MTVPSETVLTATPAQVLAAYLRTVSGLAGLVFADGQPDTPVDCVTVTSVRNTTHPRTMPQGVLHQVYAFQVRARGTTPAAGNNLMKLAQAALAAVRRTQFTYDAVAYMLHGAHQYGTVSSIAAPDKRRQPEYVCDYRVTITQQGAVE